MSLLIDLTAALVVLLGARRGWRSGASGAAARAAGLVLGVVAGLLLADAFVTANVSPVGHLLLGLLLVLGCAIVGQKLMAGLVGRMLPRFGVVRRADRVAGAVLYGVVAAAICSLVLTTVALLGPRSWSEAARTSSAAQALRPAGTALRTASDQVLSAAPSDLAALVPAAPELPSSAVTSLVATRVAASVVEIGADGCGRSVQGTGFVTGDADTVVTNAHVVRGASTVEVRTPDGRSLEARVVAYSASRDLAVLTVNGLDAPALTLVSDAPNDSQGVIVGYPGGVRTITPAAVIVRLPVPGPGPSLHLAYVIDAAVRHGNSGSPLLDLRGRVVGVVNALSETDPDAGFAITASELRRILPGAVGSTTPVPTGTCAS